MNCPIHLDTRTQRKNCKWERKNGCDFEEFRQRKQREDLIAMNEKRRD